MFAHRILGGCSNSLSISCPSLVSALIATARACLWSSFRWCSESPLLAHPETMVSCLLGRSILFPDSLPASCGTLAPFRLCSRSQPQSSPWDLTSEARASAPSPHPSVPVGEQISLLGWCVLVSTDPLCRNLSTLPSAPLLLRSPPWLCSFRPPPPPSLPLKGLPRVWKPFLLHSSLPEVQVPSLFFCLCFFFFLLPYPGTWGVSCLLGSLRSSASVQ